MIHLVDCIFGQFFKLKLILKRELKHQFKTKNITVRTSQREKIVFFGGEELSLQRKIYFDPQLPGYVMNHHTYMLVITG